MAKYFGSVGYAEDEEVSPGIVKERIVTREYYGDIIRNNRRLENSDQINDDIKITNQISIVSDPYAIDNFWKIRYATFMGQKWKVKTVEVEFPRLILTLGELYNG
jgi:hypothetical protein